VCVRTISSVRTHTAYQKLEWLIVENNSTQPETFACYERLKAESKKRQSEKEDASAGETIRQLQEEIRRGRIETAAIIGLTKAGAMDVDYLMYKAEKSGELRGVKDIPAVTGYIRGGCSPVGMKKRYPTVFHETALAYETIYISGGKIGAQVEIAPQALLELLGASASDITAQ